MRSQLVQITSKITSLAKSGNISRARKLFDETPHKDTIAWNAMISGYSHIGLHQESLLFFKSMRVTNNKPDHYTFTSILSACSSLKSLQFGEKMHSLVVISGCGSFFQVSNALIDMYGKCLKPDQAKSVFQEMEFRNEVSWCSMLFAYVNVGLLGDAFVVLHDMPRKVVVAWNTIIAGCVKWGEVDLCLNLFREMLDDCCTPDQWTLSSVMNACVEKSEPCYGRALHSFITKNGWGHAPEVNNSVLSFYIKVGDETDVLNAIDAIRVLNEVSWNTIIDAYMKIGNVTEAYSIFQLLPQKNLISWTSMITGFMRNGYGECAMNSFVDMAKNNFQPDDVAFGAVLHACSSLATLGHGRMIHACTVHYGFHAYPYVGNGLVNMYAKCGDILGSHKAFHDVFEKDLVSWNTMIFAFGLHGHSTQTLKVLEEMLASGIKPDKVTFIGLLMTCSHLGLENEGLSFFESMSSIYGISPGEDHVACMVDMLGRAGKPEKAKELAEKYFGVKKASLEVLFGSYTSKGDLESGAELAEELRILKPDDEMSYVLLSNLYCASGKWKQAEMVRKAMVEKGVKKKPGCSWIEVRNELVAFMAGNTNNTYSEVNVMLYLVEFDIKFPTWTLYWDGIS